MKKLLLSLAACAVTYLSGNAQVIFSDDFSDSNLPNWTITDISGSGVQWQWSNTGESTGEATGVFDHAGAANGHIIVDSDAEGNQTTPTAEHTVITSQPINCANSNVVVLSFYQFFQKYQGDTVRVQLSTDSVTWTNVYNPAMGFATNQATDNPSFVELDITALAAGQDSVYIRFDWKGKWDYWWFVDDVTLFTPSASSVEAVVLENTLSNGCNLTNAEELYITFKNKGLDPISTIDVGYSIDGGTAYTETITLQTALLRDSVYTHEFSTGADLSADGLYQLTAWVSLAGDTVNTNDTVFSVAISANPSSIPYTMGFEVPNVGNEIGGFTWTTLDANNDGATWNLSTASANTGSVHYQYFWNPNGTTSANDWLFSPCINLDATKAYKLSFFNEVGEDANGLYEERLRVKAGTDKSVVGMTETVFDFGTLDNSSYAERVATFKPATTGVYYLGFQCYSAADKWFLNIDDINVTELEAPTASFTVSATQLVAGVTDASTDAITSWQWNWGDGSTDTGSAPAPHVYAANGTYEICLIVNNLAGADTTCQNITVQSIGIDEVNGVNSVSVYPNPSHGLINVQMGENVKDNAVITISNAIGEVVATRTAKGNYKEQFNVSNYAEGVYFVNITSNGNKVTKKFVYTR